MNCVQELCALTTFLLATGLPATWGPFAEGDNNSGLRTESDLFVCLFVVI